MTRVAVPKSGGPAIAAFTYLNHGLMPAEGRVTRFSCSLRLTAAFSGRVDVVAIAGLGSQADGCVSDTESTITPPFDNFKKESFGERP